MRAIFSGGLLLTAMLCGQPGATADAIPAWNYYYSPPFLTTPESPQGLACDVVALLNRKLAPAHALQCQHVPRARLNRMLAQGESGVVLLVPKLAFEPPHFTTPVRWSAPLFRDRQLLISPAAAAIEFSAADRLAGLRFGCIPGRMHPIVQREIDAGRVRCESAPNEPALLKMLVNQRIDAITLPASIFVGELQQLPSLRERLHVSRRHLGEFDRHLLLTADLAPLQAELERVIQTLPADPEWATLLARYGLVAGASRAFPPTAPASTL